ncbi:helix-turn-helix domain-containing protein [Bacillus suaedaesalsae]|uniref:Helix-turn-helix domain-containing protein n=1 Tax=Bacillus suaedaesalsae TaxID=2810349 RepID=A0ABS2DGS4_9BACI|nr:helix-turn-helix domain-containing protein [Bacillus suaedaesalsae]MBM6617674.1 helix-turn-helix domain-containing protein [Bacillus suaedaesalsae]
MSGKKGSNHQDVEVKLKAVQEVIELGKSVASVALDIGVHRDTVNGWVLSYKESGPAGLKSKRINKQSSIDDRKRIMELEKLLKEKELENEILKKFQAFLKGKR